jgi:acyl dehydratase
VEKYLIKDLQLGQVFDLGSLTLSEEDIMSYAKQYDPLPFHIDKKIAEASIFKGLVSSGPQVFNTMYRIRWVPLFGDTVICGLELNNWKFLKPIYANTPITCKLSISHLNKNAEKHHAVITWHYEFFDPKNEMVQRCDVTVMHRL